MQGKDITARAMEADGNTHEIDTFSVLLPCQRFRIRACIMSNKDVPLTVEFGLRLVKVLDWATLEDIQSFFAFNTKETRLMIEDLALPGLIHPVEDDGVSLSPTGQEMFAHTNPDLPQMIEIEEIDESVGFDLVSFALAKKLRKLPHHRALDELSLPDRKRASQGKESVKEAFHRAFREFREARWRGTDRRIYSIVDADPEERFTAEVSVPIVVRTGNGCVVEPDFSELNSLGRPGSRDQTVASIVRHLNGMAWPDDSGKAVEFLAGCDSGVLSGFSVDGDLNLSDWMKFVLAERPPREEVAPIRHVFGGVAGPSVKDAIENWLPAQGLPERTSAAPMVWVRPRLPVWGGGQAFHDLATSLGGDTSGIALLATSENPPADKRDLERAYAPRADHPVPFASAFLLGANVLPGSLELLIDPGRWALALVHCPAEGELKMCLPIGFLTANPVLVSNIQSSLSAALPHKDKWSVLWYDRRLSSDFAISSVQGALGSM